MLSTLLVVFALGVYTLLVMLLVLLAVAGPPA